MENTCEKLEKILDNLSNRNIEESSSELVQSIKELWEYYNVHRRHNYHEIENYVILNQKKRKEGETISVISSRLNYMLDYINKKILCSNGYSEFDCLKRNDFNEIKNCDGKKVVDDEYYCYQYKQLYLFVFKLYDHIQLEFIRWSEINSKNQQFDFLNRRMKTQLGELKAKQRAIELKEDEIVKEFNELKKEMKSMSLQIVSVLGIFAAIVISVFGGLSVINNISTAFINGEITIYNTILVSSMSSMFVVWIIFTLLGMVRWFKFSAAPSWFSVAIFVVISGACITGVVYSLCNIA